MDVRQLRYFVEVARQRHFTRAAAALYIVQPALSQQIAQLERELGTLLFDRTKRRVQLTPAGETLLVHAQRILAEVELAEEEMRSYTGAVCGRVTVGTLASVGAFWLPGLLARFHACYPHVDVYMREEVTERLAVMLASGDVDLAFVHVVEANLPPPLADDAIVTEPLLTEDLVLVVAPTHHLAQRLEVAPSELHDETFVAFKMGSGLRRALHQLGVTAGFRPRVGFESSEFGTICGLVAAGLGISVISRSVAEMFAPAIIIVPLQAAPLRRTVLLAWRQDRRRSVAADACLTFTRADVAEHPWVAQNR